MEKVYPLPQKLFKKMTDLNTFVDVEKQFSKLEMKTILSHVLSSNKRTLNRGNYHFCLPHTFLIGFPKCGTTLLYNYLEEHPLMVQPRNKEGQFWREFVSTRNIEYRELQVLLYLFHFYDASRAIQKHAEMFTIDASASTVFASSQPHVDLGKDSCVVPALISNVLPDSKFLIVMRNPIERLWSDFWYFCSRSEWRNKDLEIRVPDHILSKASEMFHDFTVLAIQEFAECMNKNHSQFYCATLVGSISGETAGCKRVRLGLSLYSVHVQRWLSVIPQHKLLLIRLEDIVTNRTETLNKVWSFLNVPSIVTVRKSKINRNSWIARSKYAAHFTMLDKTKELLQNFFYPYNLKLATLANDERYLWNE
jgi:N-acetylgalactosamine 4-sulfate 6-O-sulfotransferase